MSAGRLLGGRYYVGELLGYGGMAEVHQGRDARLGRDVAIKLLRADLARDATFQMRFSREAQNAAALNHPAIVAVYDTGEEIGPHGESLPYIVMEYVNGRTLKEILTAEGPLMPRRALEISADVCAALDFSHRHGIIHRDVKPGNIMLTTTGQVKVMDFGIARALASGASTMTQTSAVIGTAQYLSPEQARGEAVDARSDVYAAGCVVYELLTGQPPFVGDNPVSVAYQHVREDPKPPSSSNRDVTPDIDAVVLKALAKNPLNRYQSSAEMRADLLRAAAGRPVLATPVMFDGPATAVETVPRPSNGPRPAAPARVRGPQRRRASAWVMATLALLGVAAAVALGTGLYLTTRQQTVTVPPLVGLTQTQANNKLVDVGLKEFTKPQTSSSCTKDSVLSTDPVAGKAVKSGSVVTLVVCSGSGQAFVPSLVNLTQDQVKGQLAQAGFTADPVFNTVPGTAAAGTVISSDPPANAAVSITTQIKVTLSDGSLANMPDLTGKSKSAATQALLQAGFKQSNIQFQQATSHSAADVNHVLNQDPAANSTPSKDAQITVYIGGPWTPPTSPPTTPPVTQTTAPTSPSPSPPGP